MLRAAPLIEGETYHVFNRGAHKNDVFTNLDDFRRFQLGLFLANHSEPILMRDVLNRQKYREPFSVYPVDKTLVDVLAYALLPNHFHLVLRQKSEGGITRFMKKLVGGYSMYFNLKYQHSGTLFQGIFKSKHLDSEAYFKWIFAYVHLNPVSLVEPQWKEKRLSKPTETWHFLKQYPHSSFYDLYVAERPERAIVAYEESLQYIDREFDMAGLLNEFAQGKSVFDSRD